MSGHRSCSTLARAGRSLRCTAVTPARDEAENLERLARCLREQTVPPSLWVVVDDGSIDGPPHGLATVEEGCTVIVCSSPGPGEGSGPLRDGRRRGRDVIAFNAGLALVGARGGAPPDIVVKLDADVSFAPDFFERLLDAFADDDRLGIAGGTCYELDRGGWKPYPVSPGHVRGATRAYRRECLEQVLPLEERLGWDGVDETRAALLGWSTRSVPELSFFHHRRVGARDGRARMWEAQGAAAYFMGYRASFLLARSVYRSKEDYRALAMVWGYARSALARDATIGDVHVKQYLHDRQRLLRVGSSRLRAALRGRAGRDLLRRAPRTSRSAG